MEQTDAVLIIELHGKEAKDGRILVTSPDLKGFYFVVQPGEDPIEAMTPTLIEFMGVYLNAKVCRIERAETPRQYRHKSFGIVQNPQHDYSLIAEVAA